MSEPRIPAPTLLLKWQTWVFGLAVMLIPFFVPIPMVLRRHPIISPLGDQLHVILLAGIALFLYWRGPTRGRLKTVALVAAFIGGAIEFIQVPFGRQAHFMDFAMDLVGIGLVVGYIIWRGYGRKLGLGLMVILFMAIPIQLRHMPFVAVASYRTQEIFPTLADLEGPRDHWLWGGNDAQVEILDIPDSPSGTGRVMRLTVSSAVRWSSAEMRRFPHNWSAYNTLLVDVRLVAAPGQTQPFTIRVDDFEGRREHTWLETPGNIATTSWQTIRVPLLGRQVTDGTGIQDRVFDIHDVDRIMLFLTGPNNAGALEFDNLRLE